MIVKFSSKTVALLLLLPLVITHLVTVSILNHEQRVTGSTLNHEQSSVSTPPPPY